MVNYIFVCKNCSPTGLESFKKNPAGKFLFYFLNLLFILNYTDILVLAQMCITAIGNLMQESNKNGNPKVYFSKDKDIVPFIESHWDSMTTTARRVTQSWHSTVCII